MLPVFPTIWLLLALPFVSTAFIRQIPPLVRLCLRHRRWALFGGLCGLACLYAGALGLLPPACELPLMLLGGLVAGFTMLSVPRSDRGSDGEDWRRRWPPHDPRPDPRADGGGLLDWAAFDRARARWERDELTSRRRGG